MPGVERLATIIDSILQSHYLRRTQIAPWLEVALMLGAAIVLGVAVSRLSLAVASLFALALIVLMAGAAQVALARYGQWQASAVPILAIILSFILLSLFRYGLLDKERRHIGNVFKRYLAPQIVERVIASPKLPELGGELREISVMFCDLRDFTSLSERLDPGTLTRVANTFFSAATEVILEQGGTVDKYVGDAIMAFWNAPLDQPDHPDLACRAALRILDKVDAINESAARNGLPRLSVGIGINTGRCTVGNFGSSRRLDYSAIGDTVNVAARLEGETKSRGMAILLGPETAARVTRFTPLSVDRVRLRGREEMLQIYTLVRDEQVHPHTSFAACHFRNAH